MQLLRLWNGHNSFSMRVKILSNDPLLLLFCIYEVREFTIFFN